MDGSSSLALIGTETAAAGLQTNASIALVAVVCLMVPVLVRSFCLSWLVAQAVTVCLHGRYVGT